MEPPPEPACWGTAHAPRKKSTGRPNPTGPVSCDHSFSSVRLPPEPSALHRQHASGAVRGRKQKARSKREMIDERSELGLLCRQMRRPVEPEGEKHDIR